MDYSFLERFTACRQRGNGVTELTLDSLWANLTSIRQLGGAATHAYNRVETIKFSQIKIHNDARANAVAKILMHGNNHIKILQFSRNEMTAHEFGIITRALAHANCRVEFLRVQGNDLEDAGLEYIAHVLTQEQNTLRVVHLLDNLYLDNGLRGFESIFKAMLDVNCNLTCLNIFEAKFDGQVLVCLAKALASERNHLETLVLNEVHSLHSRKCGMLATILAQVLEHKHCKLKKLDLGCNRVDDEGAKRIAGALKHENNRIEMLRLDSNVITSDGVKFLALALEHANNKVQVLDLFDNAEIDTSAFQAMANALMHANNKLECLNLHVFPRNPHGHEFMLDALLHPNCKLTDLVLFQEEAMVTFKLARARVLRNTLVLLSARCPPRRRKCAISRLPSELIRLVAALLVSARDVPEEEEEDEDDGEGEDEVRSQHSDEEQA